MEDPAAVAAREEAQKAMDEKVKWSLAAVLVGFVGFAGWQFIREYAKLGSPSLRKRQPWEIG
jgi:hypothetical protein